MPRGPRDILALALLSRLEAGITSEVRVAVEPVHQRFVGRHDELEAHRVAALGRVARRAGRQFKLEFSVWRSERDTRRVLATRLLVTVARSVYKCSQTGFLLSFDNSLRGYGAFSLSSQPVFR